MVKKIDFYKFYQNKKVLVTGHTGFKGSWLTVWLLNLGCNVIGVSKNVPTKPSNFENLKLKKKIKNYFLDIQNYKKLKKIILKERPDIVFHLAAQSIISESFIDPLGTINTNTQGSLNVLHASSFLRKKCSCIMITSDKCYFNLEKKSGYKEDGLLGGQDMYSGSKAAAEIILQAYYYSFLKQNKKIRFCTARAGNVIGGGDWSKNRLIPDIMKSWKKNTKPKIKNPKSIRPWQHVLEPLYGYLKLAIFLDKNEKLNGESFNFGPSSKKTYTVMQLLKTLQKNWNKNNSYSFKTRSNFHETKILKLNSQKAFKRLRWKTILNLEQIGIFITNWYKLYFEKNSNMFNFTIKQIRDYEKKTFN